MPPKKRRSTNFSEGELQSLLDTIESILPIGSGEWDRVMNEHSIDFEQQHRTVESLRRKFRDLHLKKAPTGDPNMSATVPAPLFTLRLASPDPAITVDD